MATKKKGGYIDKFLKRADKAVQEGVKRADEILDDAVEIGQITAKQASIKSKELRKQAMKEGEGLKTKGIKKINEGILAAKHAASSPEEELKALEKLGQLKKAGIISQKEFQEKKKRILERI